MRHSTFERNLSVVCCCQKSLAFNPAMLRPGATPPKKEAAPTVASFDEPAEVTTLESANKVQ